MYPRRDQPQPISSQPPDPAAAYRHHPADPHAVVAPIVSASGNAYISAVPQTNGMNMPADMALQHMQQWSDPGTAARRMGTVEQPLSVVKDGRRYSLIVAQQPIRARMCGFGDKDRRPVTPPPCVRLIITDLATGQEIDPSDIDSTYFVLTVDLWSSDGIHEVNLVRHSNHTPSVSISTTSTTSYPPPPDRQLVRVDLAAVPHQGYGAPQPGMPPPMQAYGMPTGPYGAPPPQLPHDTMGQYGAPPPQLPSQPPNPYGAPPPPPGIHPVSGAMMPPMMAAAGGLGPPPQAPPGYMVALNQVAAHAPASGMFTRNLIGSLSVNAFKLVDTEHKTGFWFVLQDLSVRTEGYFRLKMNFVDVGTNDGTNRLTTGKAPVLASSFSDVFQVYSAKKFPGVIESTPLSKAFASQGIKIPIRKDGPKIENRDEYDNDD